MDRQNMFVKEKTTASHITFIPWAISYLDMSEKRCHAAYATQIYPNSNLTGEDDDKPWRTTGFEVFCHAFQTPGALAGHFGDVEELERILKANVIRDSYSIVLIGINQKSCMLATFLALIQHDTINLDNSIYIYTYNIYITIYIYIHIIDNTMIYIYIYTYYR